MQKLVLQVFVFIGMFLLTISHVAAMALKYGDNAQAAHFHNVGDANIYYETYGQGQPLLLLHGGLFGSIAEYEKYIPQLSQSFKVIAISTRGHGKSEIGSKPFSYKLFAQDAVSILQNETNQPATILGFSDGAITGYIIGAQFPMLVQRMVLIGGGLSTNDYLPEGLAWVNNFDGAKLSSEFIKERKKLMPEPKRWLEFTTQLKRTWLEPEFISKDVIRNITAPTLIVGGDKDDFMNTNSFVNQKSLVNNAQLLILPDTGHVDALQNRAVFNQFIFPFIKKSIETSKR